jgi:RNA polymerase sigma factor (sigma-70 family)
MDDVTLLRRYVSGSNDAFDQIVKRYRGLVFSTSLRELRDPMCADDVCQTVFVLLADKADTLPDGVQLSRWLFHAARLTSANLRRKEARQRSLTESAFVQERPSTWSLIGSAIDEALESLEDVDLDIVLLRFHDQYTFPEIGTLIGVGDEAARKRVTRAVEKLRRHLAGSGILRTNVQLKGVIKTMLTETEVMREIDAMYSRMDAAYGSQVAGDIQELLEEICAADHHLIDLDGTRNAWTRDEFARTVAERIATRPAESRREHEVKVLSIDGTTAVVVVNLEVDFVPPTKPRGYTLSSEDTWRKAGGHWQWAKSVALRNDVVR